MKNQPDIGIYTGLGASHSWTWFADIFDREDYDSVRFLDEQDIAHGALDRLDVFFISGGDTFAIAQGLGSAGADAIARFVREGGIYIGTCAGAYLPLRSSLSPLDRFNFVHARIANLTKQLPQAVARPEKFCTEYGCRYVYHPVREAVRLRIAGWGRDGCEIYAPLYGGPALLPSDDVEVLAEYAGFTDSTEYLIDTDIARQTLMGNAAAVKKQFGKGCFYLFGPHFEHPDFPEANELLFDLFDHKGGREQDAPLKTAAQQVRHDEYISFLSAVSTLRIMALGLERSSYTWHIGRKVYDPEKIRVFIEAVWQRARMLDNSEMQAYIETAEIESLHEHAFQITERLRILREKNNDGSHDMAVAEHMFLKLRELAAAFLTLYFKLKKGGVLHQQRRSTCTTATCISPPPRHCTLSR